MKRRLNRYGIRVEGPRKYRAYGSFITREAYREWVARALVMAASSAVLLDLLVLINSIPVIKRGKFKE
jgi:hypothetical protein